VFREPKTSLFLYLSCWKIPDLESEINPIATLPQYLVQVPALSQLERNWSGSTPIPEVLVGRHKAGLQPAMPRAGRNCVLVFSELI
jgi:hypothetical protein